MLEEMREMATNYLFETYRNEGLTKDNIVFGFHIPPFTSISHLHMHCVILPYNNFYYVIMNDYLILRTLDKVIDNLKKESKYFFQIFLFLIYLISFISYLIVYFL